MINRKIRLKPYKQVKHLLPKPAYWFHWVYYTCSQSAPTSGLISVRRYTKGNYKEAFVHAQKLTDLDYLFSTLIYYEKEIQNYADYIQNVLKEVPSLQNVYIPDFGICTSTKWASIVFQGMDYRDKQKLNNLELASLMAEVDIAKFAQIVKRKNKASDYLTTIRAFLTQLINKIDTHDYDIRGVYYKEYVCLLKLGYHQETLFIGSHNKDKYLVNLEDAVTKYKLPPSAFRPFKPPFRRKTKKDTSTP